MSDWKDVVGKITEAAPLIGTLLGGPIGGAVGGIVKLVAEALGVEPSQEAIEAEIKRNPDALLKLKELEMAQRIKLQELVLEMDKAHLADTANARQREMEVVKATGKVDKNLYILAWTIIAGFFGLTGMLLYFSYHGIEIKDASGVLFMLLGTLATSFGLVVGYFFGSSAGSADKSKLLEKISLGK